MSRGSTRESGERPDFTYLETSEVSEDFGSLAVRFHWSLASRISWDVSDPHRKDAFIDQHLPKRHSMRQIDPQHLLAELGTHPLDLFQSTASHGL